MKHRIEYQKGDKERFENHLIKKKYILNEYRGGKCWHIRH